MDFHGRKVFLNDERPAFIKATSLMALGAVLSLCGCRSLYDPSYRQQKAGQTQANQQIEANQLDPKAYAAQVAGDYSEDFEDPITISQKLITVPSRAPSSNRPTSFFDWPIDEAHFSRGYMPNKKRPHLGIDLAGPKMTPILAAHDGIVIYVGKSFRGYGRMVMLEGKNGWTTFYAHLTEANVSEGDRVLQGQLLGGMGRTGRATGVHLHFEVRQDRQTVDPLFYLPGGLQVAQSLKK